jgi:hypothetical protein
MKNIIGTGVIMIVLTSTAFVLSDTTDLEVQQIEGDTYCEMHQLWIDTDGDFGWPDYKNTFKECK